MIHVGDCIEVMAGMEADSVDAVVTDPPYGLEFMGKEWDKFGAAVFHDPTKLGGFQDGNGGNAFSRSRVQFHNGHKAMLKFQAWCEAWGREALRVTKPGGYLLAFGGTRTHHRLVCGLEDAGWIIRDELDWIYASGFPKGKANLKPAHEPIVLARKPGPLRPLAIDECRIGTEERYNAPAANNDGVAPYGPPANEEHPGTLVNGRWPSNVLLSDAELFDTANPGVVGSGAVTETPYVVRATAEDRGMYSPGTRPVGEIAGYGDSGGYSRFFGLSGMGPSGMLSVCRICGAPIANETSTASPAPPSSAESSAATPPPERSDPGVSGAASPSPLHATDTAPRYVQTSLDGTPEPTANEDEATPKPSTGRPSRSTRRGAKPATESPPPTAASFAARSDGSTDITTTTRGLLTCASCAASATPENTLPQPRPTGAELLPVERPDSPRYFIQPKADRADREPVLRGQLEAKPHDGTLRGEGGGLGGDVPQRENVHPTVKPVDLMRHLVRLVTPVGGTVLDCFLGSGSTAIAAEMEGFAWVGIEKEPEYVAIAEARLNGTQRGLGLDLTGAL